MYVWAALQQMAVIGTIFSFLLISNDMSITVAAEERAIKNKYTFVDSALLVGIATAWLEVMCGCGLLFTVSLGLLFVGKTISSIAVALSLSWGSNTCHRWLSQQR